jgi:hypothetical protein
MKILKLVYVFSIAFMSQQLFAGMEEYCSYAKNIKGLPLPQQYERVRYDAQFIKCMAGFDSKPNAEIFMDKGIKECFFYQRPDHRPAFKNNIVPCVKMSCASFQTVMDENCKNFNTKPIKGLNHTKDRLK